MPKFTDKQERFIAAKAEGLGHEQAAILAGYAANSAAVQASKLMKRADVKRAVAQAKSKAGKRAEVEDEEARMLPHYESSLELMRHTYNNPRMPDGLRFEAAKQALPYEHGKVGDTGKKQKQKERAEELTRGKFAPKSPPKLTVVQKSASKPG